jgi:hypothetical protein
VPEGRPCDFDRRGAPSTQARYPVFTPCSNELLHFEQAFDETCHRPRCDLMVKALRGRSPVVNGMMVALDGDRATAALVLLRALGLLAAVEREEPGSDATLQALLEHRRDRVLEQSNGKRQCCWPKPIP